MKKNNKLFVVVITLLISLSVGYIGANYGGWAFRSEGVRIAADAVPKCKTENRQCDKALPLDNPGSSAGWSGFPLKTARYYCFNDKSCITVSDSVYLGMSGKTMNVLILSGTTAVLILLYRIIRRRKA